MNFLYDYEEEERVQKRAHRRECHLVWQLCEKIQFESVKHKELLKERNKELSFGSKQDRIVLPVQRSFFDPKYSLYKSPEDEKESNICENSHSNWNSSSVGRFPEAAINQCPAPNFYHLPTTRKNVWQFCKDLPRNDLHVTNSDVPGPGTYSRKNITIKKFTSHYSFNGRSSPKAACSTVCSVFNEISCSTCNQTPTGDYFYSRSTNTSLCQQCFTAHLELLQRNPKIVQRIKKCMFLESFQKVRHCDFYHEHFATERAVTRSTISIRDIRKKLKLENYLHHFQR